MKHILHLCVAVLVVLGCGVTSARAIDQAMPGGLPANHPPVGDSAATPPGESPEVIERIREQDRTGFMAGIELDALRRLAVQHEDQLKILDSWARQSLSRIRHRQSIDGQDPLYTALDMAFRPEAWSDKNIIYVQAVPIRRELALLVSDPAEQKRMITEATVSPDFVRRKDVEDRLSRIALNTILERSVSDVFGAVETFDELPATLRIVPPAPPARHAAWLDPVALLVKQGDRVVPAPGFSDESAQAIQHAYMMFAGAWREDDVGAANQGIAQLTALLPAVNAGEYPAPFKRNLELWYSRTFNGTLIAYLYGAAGTLFAVAAAGGVKKLRRPAMICFTTALACHIAATGVRWYLAGRIPIQNEFESLLGAALLGCLVGWCLEVWRKNNLFGMAFAAVGFLAMTACFVFPFVVGTDMGASIGRVAGILSTTYWLYIHVNVVIWSYALIAASFVLGSAYLLTRLWHWINPLEPGAGQGGNGLGGGGGAMAGGTGTSVVAPSAPALASALASRRLVLEHLDAANMVILQMAFWMLGTGIVFGAIWADVSWGRPWGWDPKETFALVTWIVYLIIVHVRFVTPRNKATWTAALSIAGFAIMLFNWIGVNFFLAGLHSYA